MKRYDRIMSLYMRQPWAILPSKLVELCDLARLKMAGIELSAEEIQARISPAKKAKVAQSSGNVAVIPLHGVVAQRMSMFEESSGGTSIERVTKQFRAAMNDPAVKSIILDIDSPGGGVYGVAELSTEIFESRGTKPITAQVNSLAASAAYWIGSAADEMVITPGGEAGSIGVYAAHVDMSGALEAEGYKVSLVSAGKYKVEGNPYEPLTEEARAALTESVNDYYKLFVSAVARNRGVSEKDVREGFGEGRVVGASKAKSLGMVDSIGTMTQTLESYGIKAGSSAKKSEGWRSSLLQRRLDILTM